MLSTSVIGTQYWASHITKNCLDQRFKAEAISGLRHIVRHLPSLLKAKRIVILGHGFPDTVPRKIWFLMVWTLWAISKNRQIYFYWIGSEVYRKPQNTRFKHLYLRLAQSPRVYHLCGARWFVEPLKSLGIDATCLLFPYDTFSAKRRAADWPTAPQLHVLTYLTRSHWKNNNGQWIADAARKYPSTTWTIIGMSQDQAPETLKALENVTLAGWVENPAEIMAQSHLFVRLTYHDAYAGTVRDAQKMRRIVIYTKPVGDVILVDAAQQSTFDVAFAKVAATYSAPDLEQIEGLRSSGEDVPDCKASAQALSNFLVN